MWGTPVTRPVRAVGKKGVGVESAQRPGSFEQRRFAQELLYQCLLYLHPVFGLRLVWFETCFWFETCLVSNQVSNQTSLKPNTGCR